MPEVSARDDIFQGNKYAAFSKVAAFYNTSEGESFHKDRPTHTDDDETAARWRTNGMLEVRTNPNIVNKETEAKALEFRSGFLAKLQKTLGDSPSPETVSQKAGEIDSLLKASMTEFTEEIQASGINVEDVDVNKLLMDSLNMTPEEAAEAQAAQASKAKAKPKK